MRFRILAEKNANDKQAFIYDNVTNTLSAEDGFVFERGDISATCSRQKEYVPFSKDAPLRKSRDVRVLKIQMGLSCNYACDYCSQRFVERPKETTKKDIDAFMEKLRHLNFNEKDGLKIEMWGGEPFVYWKTMKPLVAALKEEFKDWLNPPRFSVITNGSILTPEICNWLVDNGFSVAVSHDGPGQHVRGPDPFEDPKQKEIVLSLYKRLKPLGRMSFNSMLNAKNTSRKEIFDWFVNFTGDENVPLGEGSLVDSYDEGGLALSLTTKQQHFDFRKKAFSDVYLNEGNIGFGTILNKIDGFTDSVLTHTNAKFLNQKCGMDDENVLAIDMRGDVLTCQNVSGVAVNTNGTPHLGGNITDIESVAITTSTHWSNRPHCAECPVLHVCQGSCMFVQDEFWDQSCANAYSDAVAVFALSIEKITGYIPYFIDAPHLPDVRKDIWGTILKHEETPTKKKIIPITLVAEKTVLDGVEVYTKTKEVTL